MKKPHIYISGEISDESYIEFSKEFRKIYSDNKVKQITISITSEGGNAYAALAYYDLICSVDKQKPVTTIATGLVASAASLIFMAGTERYMTNNAWIMVHEDSLSGVEDLRVTQIEKEAKHGRRLEDQWCLLMSLNTGISVEEWKKLHENETYISATEALAMGIIKGTTA